MSIAAVIPAYNSATLLPHSIGSALAQTVPADEIIVVDDGSTDDTARVAATYPIHLVRQKNRGIAGARNSGIRAAESDWIALLDADDLWYPQKIERVTAAIREYPEAAVFYSDARVLDPSGAPLGLFLDGKRPASGWVFERLLESMFVLPSTAVIRKDAFIKAGMFSEHLHCVEDYDLWLRMSPDHQFQLIPEPLTGYCRQDSSLSRNTEKMRRAEISILLLLLETALSPTQKAKVRRRLASNMFSLSYDVRSRNPHEAVRYAWESLRMNPRRFVTWKLLAARIAGCI